MIQITLETTPQAIALLLQKVEKIEKTLSLIQETSTDEPDRWLNLNQLCDYHPDKPTIATVYGWVAAQKIPNHKGGKRLRFLKSEIDEWLKEGRRKTSAETAIEAQAYLSSKK